jgi:hypothetical protein
MKHDGSCAGGITREAVRPRLPRKEIAPGRSMVPAIARQTTNSDITFGALSDDRIIDAGEGA